MSELQTLKCYLAQLPATIIQLLGINPPLETISEPVQPIIDMYQGIERISFTSNFKNIIRLVSYWDFIDFISV